MSNSGVFFSGLDTYRNSGAARLRFELYDLDGDLVGTFPVIVAPQELGTTDATIAAGMFQVAEALRHYANNLEALGKEYEGR